jgi:hypothetical protein
MAHITGLYLTVYTKLLCIKTILNVSFLEQEKRRQNQEYFFQKVGKLSARNIYSVGQFQRNVYISSVARIWGRRMTIMDCN